MATGDIGDVRPPRRIIVRRRAAGFGAGSATSDSLRTPRESQEPDEVDNLVDPEQFSQQLREGTITAPEDRTPPPERESPRDRLNQVSLAGSRSYAKEYRLNLLHRLLMRNIPLDQIAAQLQVSISTVEKDRVELKKRLREVAKELNIDELVGNQMSVYDEIGGMAMRIASSGATRDEQGNVINPVPTPMRLAAMRTALAAQADRSRFLGAAGVFDVLKFRRSEDGNTVSDVQHLMQRTEELLAELMDDSTPTPSKPAHGPNPNSFKAMTFDDADASGSLNEIQEI